MSHLQPIDPNGFKRALGQWASGVTIVTTYHEGSPYGMTASSFSSLSLDPPLVLICVDERARLHKALPETQRYGVNILAAEQEALSTHFAGKHQSNLKISWTEAEGLPFLEGSLAHLACEVYDTLKQGDHTIFVGLMTHCEAWPEREPLLYHRGKYALLKANG